MFATIISFTCVLCAFSYENLKQRIEMPRSQVLTSEFLKWNMFETSVISAPHKSCRKILCFIQFVAHFVDTLWAGPRCAPGIVFFAVK